MARKKKKKQLVSNVCSHQFHLKVSQHQKVETAQQLWDLFNTIIVCLEPELIHYFHLAYGCQHISKMIKQNKHVEVFQPLAKKGFDDAGTRLSWLIL